MGVSVNAIVGVERIGAAVGVITERTGVEDGVGMEPVQLTRNTRQITGRPIGEMHRGRGRKLFLG